MRKSTTLTYLTTSRRTAVSALCAFVLSLLSGFNAVVIAAENSAQLLWIEAESASAPYWPSLPASALDETPIIVPADLANNLAVGVTVLAPKRDAALQDTSIVITALKHYINGDLVFNGQVSSPEWQGPLVLTLGELSVFAHIETEDAVWQLHASRESLGQDFVGWVYRTAVSEVRQFENDFVLPRDLSGRRQLLPLTLAPTNDQSNGPASGQAAASTSLLQVTQSFDVVSALVGETLGGNITIRNNGSSTMSGLTLYVYFLLENTDLLSATSGCSPSTVGGQVVLYCALAGIAPGASKQIHYEVAVTEQTKPYVYATAIVSDQRHDTYLNVIENVLLDSDADGSSDVDESLLGTNPLDANSFSDAPSVIDILALYTPGAQQLYGGQAKTRINQLFALANQVFVDSGVNIVLRPVYHREVDYSDTATMTQAVDALTYPTDPDFGHPALAGVNNLRARFGADAVMMFRPQTQTSVCGLANLGGYTTQGDFLTSNEKAYAFADIAIDCPVGSVVAHEMGHIMGLTHSRRQDGVGGTFDYSTGYGVDSLFATIMAYPAAFNTSTRLGRFSNPRLDCLGQACGIDAAMLDGADAVQSLNISRVQIGSYYETKVAPLTQRQVTTLSGRETDARISMAASINEGLSFVSQVASHNSLDVNVSLQVDTAHIGQSGEYHVVAMLDGSPFVLSSDGAQPWDGSLENLSPYGPVGPLLRVQYLQILNALAVAPELANRQLQIFVAYSVNDKSELVFTSEPLVLDFTL